MRLKTAKPNCALLISATAVTGSAWPLSALLWSRFGEKAFAGSMFLLGFSLGPCLAAYAVLPP